MIQWAVFRNQIRRSILADIPVDDDSQPTWTDEQLSDVVSWALDNFCGHTALEVTVQYDNQTLKAPGVYYNMAVDKEFVLPYDYYDQPETTIRVSVESGNRSVYLDPIFYTPSVNPVIAQAGFYIRNNDILVVKHPLGEGTRIVVNYFAYYPTPEKDEDVIKIPRWAHAAVAYLAGAHALSSVGVGSAKIDRWKQKTDAGNPEHNAFRAQQKWYLELYEREIGRHSRQDRLNGFRNP